MPSESEGATTESTFGGIPSQLAALVPSFDPAKDDLLVYQQKVSLVFQFGLLQRSMS